MLNVMGNENKSFTNISVFSRLWSQNMVYVTIISEKEIKILVKILFLFTMVLFNKMKLLVMLQVKASKLVQDSQQWVELP